MFLSLSGFLLKKYTINSYENNTFEENGLFGFLLIGFIALFLNFFLPLSMSVNKFIFIFIIYLGYRSKFFDQNKKKLFKNIFYVSLLAYILFIYSNVNRPDALLYHIPYSKMINEYKIIIGSSNIHSRFGHISIFQYISSFFVNNIFSTNGLLLPASLLTSFFFIFTYKRFNENFRNIKTRLSSYFIFLILIYSFYSFNRYSGWGNDAQVHIFYLLSIIYLLDYSNSKYSLSIFKKISLICLFTFLIKPFYIISLIVPFIIYVSLRKKFIILRSKFFIFSFLFISLWFFKNILISGCLIYPLSSTCNSNIPWFNSDTKIESQNGEAWAKDWVNRADKNLNHEEYIKDLRWVLIWSKNHLLIVTEKIMPVIIFILFNILFFYFTKCLSSKNKKYNNNFYLLILFVNFLGVLIWFLKFPIYRYGSSYIFTFILFIFYFIFIKFIDLNKLNKFKYFFTFCILIFFSGIMIKNLNRISENYNLPISPMIFDKIKYSELVKNYDNDGNFIYYSTTLDALCGYYSSPCTNSTPNIKLKYLFGYKIYLK
jgi:hypothetical protein